MFLGGGSYDGYLFLLLIIAFLAMLLFMARAGKSVIIIALFPMIVTIGLNRSQYFSIPLWVSIVSFIILGAVFYSVWSIIIR